MAGECRTGETFGRLVGKEEAGMETGRFLTGCMKFTRAQVRSLKFKENGIQVNHVRARVNQILKEGDLVEAVLGDAREKTGTKAGKNGLGSAKQEKVVPTEGRLEILYEDQDLIAVWKPAGLPSHPGRGHYQDSLANRIQAHLVKEKKILCKKDAEQGITENEEIRSIGRLDKDTSGILVFAKNRAAAQRLWKQREGGIFWKEYLAWCTGDLKKEQMGWQKIQAPVMPVPGELNKMCVSDEGKEALTWYRILKRQKDRTLIRVRLGTGRTHQIRVHMAWTGHPLEGDPIYGKGKSGQDHARLSAWRAELKQPFTGEKIRLQRVIRGMQGISGIPFGMLSVCADGKEVQIQKVSREGFIFRTAEELPGVDTFSLNFYDLNQAAYQNVDLSQGAFRIETAKKKPYWQEYRVFVKDLTYKEEIQKLVLGYGRYIRLKLEEDDGELTQVMTGYPAWKDEIYSESLEEQKEKWFAGEKKTLEAEEHRKAEQTRKMRKTLEMALELDRPELYDAYLSKGIRNFIKEYWRQNGLENCAAAKRLPERLYFGNQFCHLLFPEEPVLLSMMEQAYQEDLKITLSFSYVRDYLLEETAELLKKLDAWCLGRNCQIEVVVNDWGMADILQKETSHLVPVLGILLNKRKKDPRMPWKKGNLKLLERNSLNAEFYRTYLKQEFGIERYEWETCGYPQDFPDGKHFVHLPFYQTNTSQYCTLAAGCQRGDRGKQKLLTKCPFYCQEKVYLYPDHLQMTGRYNSLFALDRESLKLLDDFAENENAYLAGASRLVWNLL